jgi:hypothetical protein
MEKNPQAQPLLIQCLWHLSVASCESVTVDDPHLQSKCGVVSLRRGDNEQQPLQWFPLASAYNVHSPYRRICSATSLVELRSRAHTHTLPANSSSALQWERAKLVQGSMRPQSGLVTDVKLWRKVVGHDPIDLSGYRACNEDSMV